MALLALAPVSVIEESEQSSNGDSHRRSKSSRRDSHKKKQRNGALKHMFKSKEFQNCMLTSLTLLGLGELPSETADDSHVKNGSNGDSNGCIKEYIAENDDVESSNLANSRRLSMSNNELNKTSEGDHEHHCHRSDHNRSSLHHHHHHHHHHHEHLHNDATHRTASIHSHGADSAHRCDSHDNSCCSSEEFLSDPSLYDRREASRRAWKKLRQAIVWSPFVQYYKRRSYLWVQLAGHEGNFKPGQLAGTILKKLCARESKCLQLTMRDILRPFVPEFKAEVMQDGEAYLEMKDLLVDFDDASIMDCKMGTRTYLESELEKMRRDTELRPDMYKKMVEVDPNEPTPEEHAKQAITKVRYMQWREAASSSSTLGFRIEGMNRPKSRDFKQIRTADEVKTSLRKFVDVPSKDIVLRKFVDRLQRMKEALLRSPFFATHELVGTSLFFAHDHTTRASVWIIDFGKTVRVPENCRITHSSPWIEGNHEDGYMIGFENLLKIFTELMEEVMQEKNSQAS